MNSLILILQEGTFEKDAFGNLFAKEKLQECFGIATFEAARGHQSNFYISPFCC